MRIPAAVSSTTACQAKKMKYESAVLATVCNVNRGTTQCSMPRNELARKPYATAFV